MLDRMHREELVRPPTAVSCGDRASSRHQFLVVPAPPHTDPIDAANTVYARLGDTIRDSGMVVVHERIFGSLAHEDAVTATRNAALLARGIDTGARPTYVQGRPTWGDGLAGVILHTVACDSVRPVTGEDGPCGHMWQIDDATFLILQRIVGLPQPSHDQDGRAGQARRAMERADEILRTCGMDYRRTVRTWFYLADILDWYGEFNRVRNAAYNAFGLMPRPGEEQWRLPASTGIRAESRGGASCSLDLLAIARTGAEGPPVEFLRNPRQQEAFCYGSAFSRCAVVHGSREKLIELSGTAAIDEKGRSLYSGDVRAQARCTIEKVAALLEQARATLRDIRAATIFVKNGRDADAARDAVADMGLDPLSAVWVEADVCREELLFEIDAEAVVCRGGCG